MLKTALQLYSIRTVVNKDNVSDIFARLAEMGYDGVELAGTYGISAEQLKQAADAAGLVIVSAHIPFTDMIADPQSWIEYLEKIGCKQAVIPHMARGNLPGGEGWAQTKPGFLKLAEVFGGAGITLAYHNHDFEFETVDGRAVLDIIYDTFTPEQLQTQIDTCWVNVGGVDPVTYVGKYAGRCPTVHLKDFTGVKNGCPYALIGVEDQKPDDTGTFEFRPCGYGVQDFPAILRAVRKAGADWVIVEQDEPSMGKTPLECAQMSIQYLKGLEK